MGVPGKASDRRHSLSLTLTEQETSATLPFPENYSLSMHLLLAGDSWKVTGRDGGSCPLAMHSLSGSKPGTADPIGTLGMQMVGVGGFHGADLEIQGFQNYYYLIQKARLMQEDVPTLQRCPDVPKRPTPLIPSHWLVSSTWFCVAGVRIGAGEQI